MTVKSETKAKYKDRYKSQVQRQIQKSSTKTDTHALRGAGGVLRRRLSSLTQWPLGSRPLSVSLYGINIEAA